jgi:hypothetical protein
MVKLYHIYIWFFLVVASVLGIVAIHDNEVIPAVTKIKITGGSTIDAVGGTCTDSSVTESKYSRYYLIPLNSHLAH